MATLPFRVSVDGPSGGLLLHRRAGGRQPEAPGARDAQGGEDLRAAGTIYSDLVRFHGIDTPFNMVCSLTSLQYTRDRL